MSNRTNTPFVAAVIEEIMRHCPMYYTNAAHMTIEETELGGLTFPEGTTVLVNYGAIQRDPKHFKDPDVFR
jgi:cytochrome P450